MPPEPAEFRVLVRLRDQAIDRDQPWVDLTTLAFGLKIQPARALRIVERLIALEMVASHPDDASRTSDWDRRYRYRSPLEAPALDTPC